MVKRQVKKRVIIYAIWKWTWIFSKLRGENGSCIRKLRENDSKMTSILLATNNTASALGQFGV